MATLISRLAISGYCSLRDVRIALGGLNVVTGANDSGKSSLYRALRLLADVAQGRVIQSLAGEGTAELSDGTLRYLLLVAALLSPRPPALMILNEPETSLHPDLLPPLARLIARASERSQLIVVTHAAGLADALLDRASTKSIILEKQLGETIVKDENFVRWAWPTR